MAEFFMKLINYLIANVGLIITAIMELLPQSPFADPTTPPPIINLGYITWLLDFPTWIKHFTVLLTAIGVWYVIRIAARWIKLARD